jgi:hypothetical protein
MFKKARESIYLSEGTDAEEWYASYLEPELGKCIKITKNSVTDFDGTFEDKWKYMIKNIVSEITTNSWMTQMLDSVLLQIDLNSTKATDNRYNVTQTKSMPVYALQSKIQDDCVTAAAKTDYDPITYKKSCETQHNVVQFKVSERYAQDILIGQNDDYFGEV